MTRSWIHFEPTAPSVMVDTGGDPYGEPVQGKPSIAQPVGIINADTIWVWSYTMSPLAYESAICALALAWERDSVPRSDIWSEAYAAAQEADGVGAGVELRIWCV